MRTNKVLTTVLVMQSVVLLAVWAGPAGFARPAHAELNLPDPGARQLQMIDELKGVNARLDRLTAFLQSGDVHVKTTAADDKK